MKILKDKNNKFRIKKIAIAVTLAAAVTLATFLLMPYRPIGPYWGSVVDAESGKPLKGAYVLIYWEKLVPHFEISTKTIATRGVESNEKGGYFIPFLLGEICKLCLFESTTVIVYHPAYQAFIMKIDHLRSSSKKDSSFSKWGSEIRLKRIPPNFDHKEHTDDIRRALRGIDEYSYPYPIKEDPHMTWEKLIEINLRGMPEKRELLRRMDWEFELIPKDYIL